VWCHASDSSAPIAIHDVRLPQTALGAAEARRQRAELMRLLKQNAITVAEVLDIAATDDLVARMRPVQRQAESSVSQAG